MPEANDKVPFSGPRYDVGLLTLKEGTIHMKYIAVVAVLLSFTISALGQIQTRTALPAGSISGAEHPELISDDVAWRMFITINSELKSKAPHTYAHRLKEWSAAGLSSADITTIDTSLVRFHQLNKSMEESINDPLVSPDTRAATVLERNKQIAVERSELESFISADGLSALRHHLQEFKRTLFVIPEPVLPKGSIVPQVNN
jgi:hypothetical protein